MRGTTHAVLVPRPELAVRGDARNRSISFSDNSGNDLWVELPVVKGDAVLRSKILQVESVEPDTTFQAEPAGYDDWKQGAVLGAKFALAAVKASSSIVVVEITGLTTDTNPSIVAAPCAHAVWNALGVTPPEAALQHLNATVLSSCKRPCDALPSCEP